MSPPLLFSIIKYSCLCSLGGYNFISHEKELFLNLCIIGQKHCKFKL